MSNEIAVQQQKSLAPSNLEQAINLANIMADSALVPKDLQKKPADCLLVIEQAIRWGMSPFAVAQCASVIHGKLMFEGKLVAAVVNANGDLEKRLSYEYSGEGENRKLIVSGLVRGESSPRIIEVILKDVKTDNTHWKKQPDQQLMYSGARIWARRHMPELMLGVYTPEEEISEAPNAVISSVVIEPQKAAAPADPETGEISPHQISIILLANDSGSDWMEFGKKMAAAIKSSNSVEDLDSWISHNESALNSCHVDAPKIHTRLVNVEKEVRESLSKEAA